MCVQLKNVTTIYRQLSWLEAQRSCEKEGMTLIGNFYDDTMRLVAKHYLEMLSEMGDVIFIGLKRNKQVISDFLTYIATCSSQASTHK